MKRIRLCMLFLLLVLFYSCEPEVAENENRYEKAFFLGEQEFLIDGGVFENSYYGTNNETPTVFNTISVRTNSLEGWEISGVPKGNGAFAFVIKTTANERTLSKETIQNNETGIVYIDFYLDNDDFASREYYKGTAPYTNSYKYAYAVEAQDLSGTAVFESHSSWTHLVTHHRELNFSKPGWYKIVLSDNPISNDPKHSSGSNTCLYR
ncbi:MAG: hypothetical protein LBU99_05705 [Spirochaetaceae bacterium]|nr:hypothetical protein [Spirochaetaceae bacterium]